MALSADLKKIASCKNELYKKGPKRIWRLERKTNGEVQARTQVKERKLLKWLGLRMPEERHKCSSGIDHGDGNVVDHGMKDVEKHLLTAIYKVLYWIKTLY